MFSSKTLIQDLKAGELKEIIAAGVFQGLMLFNDYQTEETENPEISHDEEIYLNVAEEMLGKTYIQLSPILYKHFKTFEEQAKFVQWAEKEYDIIANDFDGVIIINKFENI